MVIVKIIGHKETKTLRFRTASDEPPGRFNPGVVQQAAEVLRRSLSLDQVELFEITPDKVKIMPDVPDFILDNPTHASLFEKISLPRAA